MYDNKSSCLIVLLLTKLYHAQVKLGISQTGIPIWNIPNWNFDFGRSCPSLTWDTPN